MAPTTTPETTTVTVRTYELFDIAWADGARWTGFDTFEEAARMLGGQRAGEVVRRTFDVELDPRLDAAGIYRPGCGDRIVAR